MQCTVITYDSRQLKKHEQNYPTHGLEIVAGVFAMEIEGVIVRCDLRNLHRPQELEVYLSATRHEIWKGDEGNCGQIMTVLFFIILVQRMQF